MEKDLYCIVRKGDHSQRENSLVMPGNVYVHDDNYRLGYSLDEAKEVLRGMVAEVCTEWDDDDFEDMLKDLAEAEETSIQEVRKSASWYKGAGYYDNENILIYREGDTSFEDDEVTYCIEDYNIKLKERFHGNEEFKTKEDFVNSAFGGVASTNGDPYCIEGEAFEDFKYQIASAIFIEKWVPCEDGSDAEKWADATKRLDFANPNDVAAIYIVDGYGSSSMLVAMCKDYRNIK